MTPPEGHRRPHRWLLSAAGLALLAGHVLVLHYVSFRLALPVAVMLGVFILLVMKHLGLASVFRRLWRRGRGR